MTRYHLIAEYWWCSHKNYDPGGIKETVIAGFTSKKRATEYLKKNKEKLGKTWRDATFKITPCDILINPR